MDRVPSHPEIDDPDIESPMSASGVTNPEEDVPFSSTLPGPLGALDNLLARIEAVLLAAGVLLMAINTVANVVGRFVFSQSIYFTEELNRILIVVITFAGISYAARQGRHIRMSAIYDTLPHRPRKALRVFITTTTALIMFALAWYGWHYMMTLKGRGAVLPALRIPEWTILVWVPVGFAMTGLQYALTSLRNLLEHEVYLSTGVTDGYDDTEEEV